MKVKEEEKNKECGVIWICLSVFNMQGFVQVNESQTRVFKYKSSKVIRE